MDFAERITNLSMQIPKRLEHIKTEEATKNAFIMPFISALGYDAFNPIEVVPEYIADVGVKKGEKVDYAIMKDGEPIIIIEAKSADTNLSEIHSSQLFRYFSVSDVRFGILTNGIEFRFYSDIDKPNKMDDKPFFVIDMLDIKPAQIEELKKFSKDSFDADIIADGAGTLKYKREIKRVLRQQMTDPDEDFVRLLGSRVYNGRWTPTIKEQLTSVVKASMKEFINERIASRLQTALDTTDTGGAVHIDDTSKVEEQVEAEEASPEEEGGKRKIVTTQDEIDGYFAIKSILRDVIGAHRVAMRDTQSYCGILLDDNNRKPLARLHFNTAQYYLGILDADKNEERIAIDSIDDIYNYADRLQATVGYYEGDN